MIMLTGVRLALAFFVKEKKAVTAIEYAIIAGIIAIVIIAGVTSIGTSVSKTFNSVASEL